MIIKESPAYAVTIFVAGNNVSLVEEICQKYCDDVGLCVTVDMTLYVYTGAKEFGLKIGLINYARFPDTPQAIWAKAEELAEQLRLGLRQRSYTIQDSVKSVFYSAEGQYE